MASNPSGPSGFKLKLNIGPATAFNQGPPSASTTPLTATPGSSKLKLKFGNKPSTPGLSAMIMPLDEALKLKKTKAGRAPKPSAKVIESRKRSKEESDEDEQNDGTIDVQPASKRIKLKVHASGPKTSVTPVGLSLSLHSKQKGKPPPRSLGEGYDSEASDRELDPAIEEQFILRMMPGDDCDYLRQAIAEKRIGLSKQQGGADIYMKFFEKDGRRACVNIRGVSYAATLVDLPCIIEGMKSWDKRGWWKSADICQMLWVYAKIDTDSDAKVTSLPSVINQSTHQFPHGITPPMHFARKRRFRKRVHKSEIEAVEAEVERLLKADETALSTSYEILDPEDEHRRASQAWSPGSQDYDAGNRYSEDKDAEGEADDDDGYFMNNHDQGQLQQNTLANAGIKEEQHSDDNQFEEDLEAAFLEDEPEVSEAPTPLSITVVTQSQIAHSTPLAEPSVAEEDSGDESFESDEEEDDVPEEESPEQIAKKLHDQGVREDIESLESEYEDTKKNLATSGNLIIKRRLEEKMKRLTSEIQLKKSSLGVGDED